MRYRNTLITIFLILTFPLLSTIVYSTENQDEESGKSKQKTVHINKSIDLIPTVKIQYGRDYIVAKSVFPLLINEEESVDDEKMDDMNSAMSIDDFNEQIAGLIKEEVAEFKTEVTKNKSSLELPKNALKNNLRIDFNTSILNKNRNPLISIRFSIQHQYAGKNELQLKHRSFNYDFNTARELELSDLFLPEVNYLETLSAYSRDYLSKRLHHKEKLVEGTTPVAANFNIWNLQSNGLLITFDQAQVAPKRMGTQTVLVPYAILDDMIAPDSPLGECLKRKRSCLRQPVLTGGFMSAINTQHGAFNPVLSLS